MPARQTIPVPRVTQRWRTRLDWGRPDCPMVKGTRLAVADVIQLIMLDVTWEQIVEHYGIAEDDIRACLEWAHSKGIY